MKIVMAANLTRQVHFRLPIDVAIKLEVQGSKMNMNLNAYCKSMLMDVESKFASKQIDEIHKMLSEIHKDYFETNED